MFYNPSLLRQHNNTKHLRTELKKIMIITQHTHAQKNTTTHKKLFSIIERAKFIIRIGMKYFYKMALIQMLF